jgi:hemoglobin
MPMTTQSSPTLYDRVGGVYSIATVIDDFIDPIMVDPPPQCKPTSGGGPPSCASGRL